ncbi:glycosyltransferase family 2 protein [Qipengyuania citrea]|uniref:glycosyltransferase family 2 protein n=1 Tax=Qipengyuania citrea TaxID=225971 RepID=UPI00329829F3
MIKKTIIDGITVVVPTLHRPSVLLDTLRDLSKQDYDDFDILVVDQSDDFNLEAQVFLNSINIESSYVHVTSFRGLPEARNFGLRKAKRDIILYIDDDIRCGAEFVRSHFEAHLATKAEMVAGGISEANGDVSERGQTGSFDWWTATPHRNFHYKKGQWCLHAPGGNFSIRRDVLRRIGGFDEHLTIGAALYEETELGLRLRSAGYRCWFAPEAHLIHLAAPMGGCRVKNDVPRYVLGMAHNRAIVIFRHLKAWHRISAVLRMALYAASYSRSERSLSPFISAIRGMNLGRKVAGSIKSDTGC